MTRVVSGTIATGYKYDGDGARVSKTITVSGVTTTTFYIGSHYEITSTAGQSAITKYYYFGAQRVAMRTNAGVTYLHSDHLGSSNVASNGSGALISRQTYFPFGTPRASDTAQMTAVTDYGFTGQKLDASDGLMYYGARYYDAALGRFISADTIVPNPANPQSLNRYAYVLNNPVKYVDPSGHCPIDADTGGCERDDNENVIFTVDQEIYGEPPPDESVDSCHSAECWGSDPSKAKPGLTPDQKKLVKNLQDLAYVANLSSVSASSIGVIVELVACEGGPIGCAVGLAAYQPLNTYETVLGWAAFGLTTWADNVKGNTYVNFQTGEVSIGQDTAAAGFTATIGTFTGEAVTDSVVNWAGVGYSTASYMGWVPDFGPIKFSFK